MEEDKLTDADFGFQWHITNRCGGTCTHCYQSDCSGEGELGIDALKLIADDIMSAVPGPVTINVTGGEPLLYPQNGVFDLMSYLEGFDNIDELNIITSTMGMNEKTIRDLKALRRLAYVKVSLESDDAKLNDEIRWPGHYSTTVGNIRKLVDSGLRIVIMTTLSKQNYRSIAGLCSIAENLGTSGVIFERFVPLGRGAEGMHDSVLTAKEWPEVLGAIAGVAGASAEDLLPYKAFWVDGTDVSGAPCCLGRESMAVMPDGTIYPCRRVPVAVGKLPDDGMGRVLGMLGGYSSTPQLCYDFGF